VVKTMKLHTIGEKLILPACGEIRKIFFEKKLNKKYQKFLVGA